MSRCKQELLYDATLEDLRKIQSVRKLVNFLFKSKVSKKKSLLVFVRKNIQIKKFIAQFFAI